MSEGAKSCSGDGIALTLPVHDEGIPFPCVMGGALFAKATLIFSGVAQAATSVPKGGAGGGPC